MELDLVLVEHGVDGVERGIGQSRVVEDREEVDALAGESRPRQGLLTNQEPFKGWPEDQLVIRELNLDVADEFALQSLSVGDPFLKDVEHLAHDTTGFVHRAGLDGFLHHVLAGFLHPLAPEVPSLLLRHFLPVGFLDLLDLIADALGPVPHAFPHVAHASTAHERLHHRPAEVLKVRLDHLAAFAEGVGVILDQALDDRPLALVKLELFGEQGDVASGEIGLEELPDLSHPAHAHPTTTASTTPLGGGGVREIGGSGDRVEANVTTNHGGTADQGGDERTNSNPAHGHKPLSCRILWLDLRRTGPPANQLERQPRRIVA